MNAQKHDHPADARAAAAEARFATLQTQFTELRALYEARTDEIRRAKEGYWSLRAAANIPKDSSHADALQRLNSLSSTEPTQKATPRMPDDTRGV